MSPLCKDCKSYRPDDIGAAFDECARFAEDDVVRGGTRLATCLRARHVVTMCSPSGKWFEPHSALVSGGER